MNQLDCCTQRIEDVSVSSGGATQGADHSYHLAMVCGHHLTHATKRMQPSLGGEVLSTVHRDVGHQRLPLIAAWRDERWDRSSSGRLTVVRDRVTDSWLLRRPCSLFGVAFHQF